MDGVLWMTGGGSSSFWEKHYRMRGTSGPGSRGELADFKADVVNRLVVERAITSITELGCGDGYQAALLKVPRYVGLDVSQNALERCAADFAGDPSKSFFLYRESGWADGLGLLQGDMALSMDVIFHLVEDQVFEAYMVRLFSLAVRFVLVYSSDEETDRERLYTRRRRFSGWIEENMPGWILTTKIENPRPDLSKSDFYLYERRSGEQAAG